MIITAEELHKSIRSIAGGYVKGEAGDVFTIQHALTQAASYAKTEDTVNDTMRVFRLAEKIQDANGTLELSETDVDDLKERSHLRYKAMPWVFGPLYNLLSRAEEG